MDIPTMHDMELMYKLLPTPTVWLTVKTICNMTKSLTNILCVSPPSSWIIFRERSGLSAKFTHCLHLPSCVYLLREKWTEPRNPAVRESCLTETLKFWVCLVILNKGPVALQARGFIIHWFLDFWVISYSILQQLTLDSEITTIFPFARWAAQP